MEHQNFVVTTVAVVLAGLAPWDKIVVAGFVYVLPIVQAGLAGMTVAEATRAASVLPLKPARTDSALEQPHLIVQEDNVGLTELEEPAVHANQGKDVGWGSASVTMTVMTAIVAMLFSLLERTPDYVQLERAEPVQQVLPVGPTEAAQHRHPVPLLSRLLIVRQDVGWRFPVQF